jgi:hypothetical protein
MMAARAGYIAGAWLGGEGAAAAPGGEGVVAVRDGEGRWWLRAVGRRHRACVTAVSLRHGEET